MMALYKGDWSERDCTRSTPSGLTMMVMRWRVGEKAREEEEEGKTRAGSLF